jgi:hypothetical protein
MKQFFLAGLWWIGLCSLAAADGTSVRVAGLSFELADGFSSSNVLFDGTGYHYSEGKSHSKHLNVFYVAKEVPFDGDIFDSAELRRAENELKSGKLGKAFSIFGATRISSFQSIRALDSLKVMEFDSQNVSFERSLVFSDDKYFYVISFHETERLFKDAFVLENPEYFVFKSKNNPSWIPKKLEELYANFKNRKKLPDHIENLNRSIDQIMNTVKLVR